MATIKRSTKEQIVHSNKNIVKRVTQLVNGHSLKPIKWFKCVFDFENYGLKKCGLYNKKIVHIFVIEGLNA
jgi:hypothetical protein